MSIRDQFRMALFRSIRTLPRTLTERYQTYMLNVLLASTREHVAYLNAFPQKLRDLSELSSLPILTRTDLQAGPVEKFLNLSRHPHTLWRTTSGTHGRPLAILGGKYRENPTANDYLTYKCLIERGVALSRVHTLPIVRIKVRGTSKGRRLYIPVSEVLANATDVAHRLQKFAPAVVEGYASLLIELARLPQDTLPRPDFVISFGEHLTEAARKKIAGAFKCEVISRYGMEEFGVVGAECTLHQGFHVNTEAFIAEVVDQAGRPVPEGNHGRILITDLTNDTMPLVRYDTGDSGMYISECACGSPAPRLILEGRHAGHLRIHGKTIHHLEIDAALDTLSHCIEQYQIEFNGVSVIARIIPAAESRAADLIKARLQPLFERTPVDVAFVTRIQPTPRGKCQTIVDLSSEMR